MLATLPHHVSTITEIEEIMGRLENFLRDWTLVKGIIVLHRVDITTFTLFFLGASYQEVVDQKLFALRAQMEMDLLKNRK